MRKPRPPQPTAQDLLAIDHTIEQALADYLGDNRSALSDATVVVMLELKAQYLEARRVLMLVDKRVQRLDLALFLSKGLIVALLLLVAVLVCVVVMR